MALPLAGIRVVDLTSNIAAPFASVVLADLGADVVHIESPSGDDSRRMAPRIGDVSAYWQVVNRNKRIIQLDIRDPGDRAQLETLISQSDVFVSNLRPQKLAKAGLDSESLLRTHPQLIHASLSAYGHVGEEKDRAGYDAVLQARTGIAQVTGTYDGPPVRAGVSVLDVGAGTWLALGVITKLFTRQQTGIGGAVATSLFETGANWVAYHVAANQVSGQRSGRYGSGHPAFSPYGIFQTRTAQVCVGIGGDALFEKFCNALSLESLLADERFATNPNRVLNDLALRKLIEARMGELDAGEVVNRLELAGVACDVVQLPEDLLHDPQANANQVMVTHDVPGYGALQFPGLPLTLDGVRPNPNKTEERGEGGVSDS